MSGNLTEHQRQHIINCWSEAQSCPMLHWWVGKGAKPHE